jgi:hypothetical protein
MPSNRDSGRPGQPGKRRVLRKIEPAGATGTMRPPPRLSEPDRDELPLPLQRPATPRAPVTSAIARPSEPPSPAPGGTYTSVAPVVATVITPLGTTLDPPPPQRRSSLKGIVVGATLGLAIVASFVAGTRLAMRAQAPTPPAAAAQAQPQPASPVTQPAAAPAPVAATDGPPVVAATQLPVAPAPPKRGHHAWKSAPKPAAPADGEPGASDVATAPKSPPAPSSAPSAEPAPEDSAASLVPVIPAATAPPPVDPFVKAVQTDIDEDTSKHR